MVRFNRAFTPRYRKALLYALVGVIIVFKNYVIVIGQAKPMLVVLNKSDATLAIVDPASMRVTAKVPTGDGPHEVVLSDDGRIAYVANYGAQAPGSTISVIDLIAAKELRRVDLAPLFRPHGIQMIAGKIYFTAETNRLIARYDPATNKVDWMMGTGQNASHMIAGSADQKRFYTANIGSDTVTAFEFQNVPPAQSRITHIAVGKQPEAIDLSPNGKEVWTGLNAEGMVEIVDTQTNKSVGKISVGGRPYRVKFTPDGKNVVCTVWQTKEIVVIDAGSRKEVRRIKIESQPFGIVFTADGKYAFVSALQPDVVLKLSLETGEILGRVETGNVPDGLALAGL